MKKSVSIVIVNYKTPDLVLDCLDSIYREEMRDIDYKVYLVDNFSNDGSYEKLTLGISERDWSSWIEFIPLEVNRGFSYGNNRAVREILAVEKKPEYIWFLNPDTLLRENACVNLIDFLEKKPEAGIAGSRLEDPDGTAQIAAFRDFSIISEMLSGFNLAVLSSLFRKYALTPEAVATNSHETAWIAGASMLVRTELIEQIGSFDDSYFLYYEEVDLCVRARRKGWQCWFVPDSRVVHLVGSSTGISDLRKRAPRRPGYWFESRRRFFLKNYHWIKLLLADFLWMFGYATNLLRRRLFRQEIMDPPFFLRDFFKHSVFCKGFRL